jgi:hypothetical protein
MESLNYMKHRLFALPWWPPVGTVDGASALPAENLGTGRISG